MPSDKFLQYKAYLETYKTLKSKDDPATFDEWLRFPENELSEPQRNLELASALASGDGLGYQDVRTSGPKVIHEFGHHATAYLTALARSRFPRMTRMIAYCDEIEDKIMERISTMNDVDALRAYYLLGQTIAANTELIKTLLDYSRGTPVDPTQGFDIVQFGDSVNDDEKFKELVNDKHDRDRLRTAVKLLMTGASSQLLLNVPVAEEVVSKPHGKAKKRK